MVAAVMLAAVPVPAMAQVDDKDAKKAIKQTHKATPKATHGIPIGNVALLGVVALLVGGGFLIYRNTRQ
jgi:hypothetical protein